MNKLRILIVCFVLLMNFSCSDDNAPGGSNNGGTVTGIVITTTVSTSVTNNSAISGGNITSDGGSPIINRGVCWSTNPNPTIANTHTVDSSGIGAYSSNITNLNSGTLYYLRAYATNSTTTTYGNQITLTTLSASSGGCAGGPSTVTDIDGNVYDVVSIGNQCWMKENLKTTHYRNGSAIPTGLTSVQWGATTTGAYVAYNNVISTTYGKLYNWYAVADSSGLCPIGWHAPTESDWNILISYIDTNADTNCMSCSQSNIAGGAMKEVGFTNWGTFNVGATNISGFSGLPGGYVGFNSSIIGLGSSGNWWSATQFQNLTGHAYFRFIEDDRNDIYRVETSANRGYSVRCVRD